MRTNRILRAITLLLALLLSAGLSAPSAMADDPSKHSTVGPPDPIPQDWAGGAPVGVDKNGKYCILMEADGCSLEPGQLPGTTNPCSAENDGENNGCTPEDRRKVELAALKKWEDGYDHSLSNYAPLDKALTKCITEENRGFQDCMNQLAFVYPPPVNGPVDWVAGKISKMAADAMKEAAGAIGEGTVWALQQFADAFNSASTINLGQTGIGQVMGIMTVLSVLVACFLMLIQFAKVAISSNGAPLGTVLAGLGKWAVVLAVYGLALQTALSWVDAVSTWIINVSFSGGGNGEADAAQAMKTQLGTLFSALVGGGGSAAAGGAALVTGGSVASEAVGVVIVLGILCILAIGALWIEVMVRQAGIMILAATMPVTVAGQLSDATKEWWPKARNAAITLVLMKLVIVICFAIGFSAMARGSGLQNVIVGLIMFLLACFSWPALAKFVTFSTAGNGNGTGSGMLGAVGSSLGAMFGGYTGAVAGAGAVGGGSGYTRALEADNANSSGGNGGGGGGFWRGMGGGVGLGLQAASAGIGMLESATNNAAAHADLGGPAHANGTVVPPRRAGDNAPAAASPEQPEAPGNGSRPEQPASGPGTGAGLAEDTGPRPPANAPASNGGPAPSQPAESSPPTRTGPVRPSSPPTPPNGGS